MGTNAPVIEGQTTVPGTQEADKPPVEVEKKLSTFVVLARIKGEKPWNELSKKYEAIEQGKAKGDAATDLGTKGTDDQKEAMKEGGKGVELLAISQRGYKIETFSLEAPAPRIKRS